MNLGLVATLVAIVLFMSQARGDAIVTDSTSNSVVQSKSDSITTVKSPPPSAIAPSFGGMNSDLCTVGYSGAVQTQVLGVSTGGVFTDQNCERLKLAKTLLEIGVKLPTVCKIYPALPKNLCVLEYIELANLASKSNTP